MLCKHELVFKTDILFFNLYKNTPNFSETQHPAFTVTYVGSNVNGKCTHFCFTTSQVNNVLKNTLHVTIKLASIASMKSHKIFCFVVFITSCNPHAQTEEK